MVTPLSGSILGFRDTSKLTRLSTYFLRHYSGVVGVSAWNIIIDYNLNKHYLIQTAVANKEVAILVVELIAEK